MSKIQLNSNSAERETDIGATGTRVTEISTLGINTAALSLS